MSSQTGMLETHSSSQTTRVKLALCHTGCLVENTYNFKLAERKRRYIYGLADREKLYFVRLTGSKHVISDGQVGNTHILLEGQL